MDTSKLTDQELAKLSALKVMGMRNHKLSKSTWINPKTYFVIRKDQWNPPQDIAQAFQLVDKMREKSWWLFLRQVPCVEAPWQVRFEFGGMAPAGAARPLSSVGRAIEPPSKGLRLKNYGRKS